MKKRILALFLAFLTCCALLPAMPVEAFDMGKAGQINALALGEYHSALVDASGVLWMWGWNDDGQLGNGSTEDSPVPVKVMDGVAAVKTDGSLWTWGADLPPSRLGGFWPPRLTWQRY